MRLYVSGVKVPKLGSPADRVIRQFQMKEAKKETLKIQMQAMIAANTPDFDSQSKATEWSSKVKEVWSDYMSIEYGLEIKDKSDANEAMTEAYTKLVKNLKPVLTSDNGALTISGLDSVFAAHGIQK